MIRSRSKIAVALALAGIAGGGVLLLLPPREAVAPESESDVPARETNAVPISAVPSAAADAPFYFTTMTHMEGIFKDDKDEDLFDRHVAQIRWAMDLFDEYGAKLTIESEKSFAKANDVWGTNVLKEVLERGHGVGTHADFGAERKPLGLAAFTQRFKENKALVDALVGAENNRGVSGGQGAGDWVTAAARAGFAYMDGVVGFAYLSMPESERPEGWTDEAIRSTYYHDNAPVDLALRTHPFWLKDATDFDEDADGVLLINGGDAGELASMAEGRSNCAPDCDLTAADADAVEEFLKEALALHDGSSVGKLNVHVPLVLLTEKNESVLRQLLAKLKEYADAGTITLGTQRDVYDDIVDENP